MYLSQIELLAREGADILVKGRGSRSSEERHGTALRGAARFGCSGFTLSSPNVSVDGATATLPLPWD